MFFSPSSFFLSFIAVVVIAVVVVVVVVVVVLVPMGKFFNKSDIEKASGSRLSFVMLFFTFFILFLFLVIFFLFHFLFSFLPFSHFFYVYPFLYCAHVPFCLFFFLFFSFCVCVLSSVLFSHDRSVCMLACWLGPRKRGDLSAWWHGTIGTRATKVTVTTMVTWWPGGIAPQRMVKLKQDSVVAWRRGGVLGWLHGG